MLSHNCTNNLQQYNCTILRYNNNNDQHSFDKWAESNGIAIGLFKQSTPFVESLSQINLVAQTMVKNYLMTADKLTLTSDI